MRSHVIVAALATFAPAAFAGLPTGLSGAWYNPAQSGHGIHLEMLSGDAATGAWNVFDTAGNPMHLYFEGRVEEGRLVANAYAPRGMKFGSFDRSAFSAPRWGSLVLDFSDCDHATLRYAGDGPSGAGFGTGSMPLQRLTRIAGTTCSFTASSQAPAGAYEGTWNWAQTPLDGQDFRVHAAVDADGKLWATTAWTPGPTYVSAVPYPPLLVGSIPAVTPGGFEAAAVARQNTAITQQYGNASMVPPTLTTVHFETRADGAVVARANGVPGMFADFEVARPPGENVLDTPAIDLRGKRYTFIARGQFFDLPHTIEFRGRDGSDICFVSPNNASLCEFSGRLTSQDAQRAMFDFFLDNSLDPGRVYHGKAWIRSDTGELVMVAEGGELGFGLVAVPKN